MVRPLTGLSSVAVYLPILSATDLTCQQARELLHQAPCSRAMVKAVADKDPKEDISPGAPVLMRLPLESGDTAFKRSSSCKRSIKKAIKAGLEVRSGTQTHLLKDGYLVYKELMHRHGTPCLPFRLFDILAASGLGRMYVAYQQDSPVAMLWLMTDGDLAWVPWCGALAHAMPLCPNHLTHLRAQEDARADGATLFDFGRSPMAGGTFEFKRRWGAVAVPLRLFTTHEVDLYGKYELASRLWRALPAQIANRLGPIVCRALPEL